MEFIENLFRIRPLGVILNYKTIDVYNYYYFSNFSNFDVSRIVLYPTFSDLNLFIVKKKNVLCKYLVEQIT